MKNSRVVSRLLYGIRDLRLAKIFPILGQYATGSVLDVGGSDFYPKAARRRVPHSQWTTLEIDASRLLTPTGTSVWVIHGDGCRMPFCGKAFDTALCVQVLEHVFEPLSMVREIARVLRPGGHAVFVVPQTAVLHGVPHHYQNLTRFWLLSAMERADLEVLSLTALGGAWSTLASRLALFFVQSARAWGTSYPDAKRNLAFFLLFPLMALFALVSIPVCLVLSLGDLVEEANNHVCVARKPVPGQPREQILTSP